MKRFRGGLVFKAHRLLYHSTLGLSVIKKKKKWLKHKPLATGALMGVLAVNSLSPEGLLAQWFSAPILSKYAQHIGASKFCF